MNWNTIGKIAIGVAILGVSGTTALLIVRHYRKKKIEKKEKEQQEAKDEPVKKEIIENLEKEANEKQVLNDFKSISDTNSLKG